MLNEVMNNNQILHPYPANFQVGDEVIDWQVYYMQCFLEADSSQEDIERERPTFQGKVISLEKPADMDKDSGGYEFQDGNIVVQFGDGGIFFYPVTVEHYLAKVGDPEVPLPQDKTYSNHGVRYGAPENTPMVSFILRNADFYRERLEKHGLL